MQQNIYEIISPLILVFISAAALWRIGLWPVKKYISPLLGKIEVVRKYNGEKLLAINGWAQGVSIEDPSIEKSYWFYMARETLKFCRQKKDPRILMLGLGANTIPNLIAQKNPTIHQTLVEIDKYIIQACRECFDLDKLPNYQLIHSDAYKLINKPKAFLFKFDVIIVDIFTGKPPYISLQSNKPTFIEKLLPWLKKEGMIIFNRPGNTQEAREDSRKLQQHLDTIFEKTSFTDIKDPRGYRCNEILAVYKKPI